MSEPSPFRRAEVFQLGELAGQLTERAGGSWSFTYLALYDGPPISLTMPVRAEPYEFPALPPALEGLLPEGLLQDSLLKTHKIDRHDSFRQLVTVGADLVGSLTIHEVTTDQKKGA